MASRLAAALLSLALAAACQLPGQPQRCTVMIDWVNFIQVGSTQYVAGPEAETVLQENELGPVYRRVKFRLSGNICDPGYHPKDGDAAFLDPGTPIFQVSGRAPSQQLAARFNGRILLYRAVPPAP
jgi:hypothetical protein